MAATILDTIVDSVRTRLPERMRERPAHTLRDSELFSQPVRSLQSALRQDRLAVIAEIKAASPSAGWIRENPDVSDIALSYRQAGAAAVSVVTEPDHFQGRLEWLELARRTAEVPVLRKDFIIDPYQILEAKAFGADAVLLIAAILDASLLAELHEAAAELGMDALVEIHDGRELDRVDLDRIRILGVNNRNLRTFNVDIRHAGRVLAGVPERLVRVAESGLKTANDLATVRRQGIDAVLIGEAFMRAPNPGLALKHLVEGAVQRSSPAS
jgi:indole-3-glycerol phosphate synthase